ncbi:MAG: hypothetical protein R3B84_10565 [Zavarzinella sp.]
MVDENWLDAAIIICPKCDARLFRVIHSPFCDDYRLYCDQCPRAVEISYYDPNFSTLMNSLGQDPERQDIMAAMEPLLKPCLCGGHFHDQAPRHCFDCGMMIIEAANYDLSPYIGCEDTTREPTAEEQAKYDSFERTFIGRDDLWI